MVTTTVDSSVAPTHNSVPFLRRRTLRDAEILVPTTLLMISLAISRMRRSHARRPGVRAWVQTALILCCGGDLHGLQRPGGNSSGPAAGHTVGDMSLVVTATGNGNTTATTTATLIVN